MCKINRNVESDSIKSLAIQKPKPEKEKRRNNEKRKEKSRDAARCRRSRETEIFTELASSLPMKSDEVDHLDKASVMRLSISYLKVRNMLELFPKIKNLDLPVENEVNDEEDSKNVKMQILSKYIEDEQFALMALDGFLLVLNDDGDVTYVSENIADILGLSKNDMMGQPIWDYAHACDHDELRETLNGRKTSPSEMLSGSKSADCNPLLHRDMMLRLKCTLTKSGRFVNIKSAAYKVIHLTGHIVFKDDGYRQLLAIGRPLAHPSNIEVPLGSSTFLTKHTLDMKFSYVDSPKMFELMGYKPEHLLGKSLYDYHHGSDSESLMTSFKCLISKGQTETNRYRFLARNGGYVWIVTQATVVFDKQKPQSVVCVNYVISGIENEHEILSCAQLEAQQELSKAVDSNARGAIITDIKVIKRDNIVLGISDLKQKKIDVKPAIGSSKSVANSVIVETASNSKKEIGDNNSGEKITINPINTIKVNTCEIVNRRPRSVTAAIFAHPNFLPKIEPEQVKPSSESSTKVATKARAQSATAKIFRSNPQTVTSVTSTIFAPRTKDMNKGFLMFSEDEPGLTMLKDEPDDLTHLAPTAGDACIPLDETAPFFSDMFDDFIIPDNYNALLTDELNSLDSSCSKTTTTSSSSNDPFINYRDDSNDVCHSPHLLSPGLSKSPDANSLPSLCSPGSLPEDELAFMTLNMDDDLDMSMRAPYISMSESSELPMLIAEDLMWGAQPDLKQTLNVNKKPELSLNSQPENVGNPIKSYQQHQQQPQKSTMESSLASLLCNQLLQHHQQQIHEQQQQQQQQLQQQSNQSEQQQHQTILNQHPEVKIKILNQGGNISIVNSNANHQTTRLAPETIEWTMNDLLQLKKQPTTKINHERNDDQNASVGQINQMEHAESIVKCKEKSNVNHKRPSLACEISSSKRAKGQETIKATPQLLQQLIATPECNQKARVKVQSVTMGGDTARWSPQPSPSKAQQQQPASNSVLMNLLVSGCDKPLTIDTPDDSMESSQDSMTSPIVINDKMLSHSAVAAPTNQLRGLLTPNDLEIYRAIQEGVNERKIVNDPYTSFIDVEAISSILMDLNEQDYEVNIPVNELLKMM